jgi:hypothetical protein
MKRVTTAVFTTLLFGWTANYLVQPSISISAPKPVASGEPTNKPAKGTRSKATKASGKDSLQICSAYDDPPVGDTDRNRSAVPSQSGESADDEKRGEAQRVIDSFIKRAPASLGLASLQYVIALVPDPRHTRLSMFFDRSIEAIQDAAEDDGYTYDSSWLPWRVEKRKYDDRDDELAEKKAQEASERCPGVLLFRQSVRVGTPAQNPYRRGCWYLLSVKNPPAV